MKRGGHLGRAVALVHNTLRKARCQTETVACRQIGVHGPVTQLGRNLLTDEASRARIAVYVGRGVDVLGRGRGSRAL